MLNKRIKEAMKKDDPNISELGQRLNSSRTKVLQDLKKSMNEYISIDLYNRLTDQNMNKEDNTAAQDDLEKVISSLFELKLTQT